MLSDPNDPVPTDPAPGPSPGVVIPEREKEARVYREQEALRAQDRDLEPRRNRNNGEEQSLRDPRTQVLTYAANATKGMPHNEIGEVVARTRVFSPVPNEPFPSEETKLAGDPPKQAPSEEQGSLESSGGEAQPTALDPAEEERRFTAYDALLRAINSEAPADFARIPIGPNPDPNGPRSLPTRPFIDPQAGLALDLEGPDAPTLSTYRGTLTPEPILFVPAFPTAELAADIGEIYLMALSRDVHVTALQGNTESPDYRVNDAVRLMNQFSGYRGPLDPATEMVTPQSLFRGGNVLAENGPTSRNEGELVGPYLSQFLIIGSRLDAAFPPALTAETGDKREAGTAAAGLPRLARADGQVLYGTLTIDQKQFEVVPGVDFVTDYPAWRQILQGVFPRNLQNPKDQASQYTGERRFVYSLRQMSEYVHRDQTYQEGLIAALLILSMTERFERLREAGRNPPSLFNPGNAYRGVANQAGFSTFGNGHVLALLAEANTRAIKAAWAGKWVNHRWLRPEVLGGRIHNVRVEAVKPGRYNLSPEITGVPVDVFGGNDPVVDTDPGAEIMALVAKHNEVQNAANGRPTALSFLLPQAYPEGSPTHPTYPAGHATQIAAEVTVLKGLFNESFPITDPFRGEISQKEDYALVPNESGTALEIFQPQRREDNVALTLGGELNKLAANVALARSIAGVHFRLDYSESMLLGEYVGLGILQEQARSFNQARRVTVDTVDGPFFFELTLFSGIKVRVLADGTIVEVPRA